jgi:hypothetical protein
MYFKTEIYIVCSFSKLFSTSGCKNSFRLVDEANIPLVVKMYSRGLAQFIFIFSMFLPKPAGLNLTKDFLLFLVTFLISC